MEKIDGCIMPRGKVGGGRCHFRALILAFLALPLRPFAAPAIEVPDPAAECVKVVADVSVIQWPAAPGRLSTRTRTVRALVSRKRWPLEDDFFMNATNQYSFDGSNIVERTWIKKNQEPAAHERRGEWWTRTYDSLDGNPSQPPRVSDHLDVLARICWLALCSAPTLNRADHKLYPVWDMWKEYIDAATFREKSTRFEDDLGLPETILLFAGENQPVLDYRVVTSTNVAGWWFPLEFLLVQYGPTGTKGWMLNILAHGKVTSIGADEAGHEVFTSSRREAASRRFVPVTGSKVHLEGTSDVHDWSLESTKIVGFLEVDEDSPVLGASRTAIKPGKTARIEAYIPVRSVNSGSAAPLFSTRADGAMLHQLLRTREHPNIEYRLTELALSRSAGIFDTRGELVLGGVTNELAMPVSLNHVDGGRVRIRGSTTVRLSDFNVPTTSAPQPDVPVKIGDKVAVSVDLLLEKVSAR